MSPNHRLASALSAIAVLAALGAAWAARREPGLWLTARLPAAENAALTPLSRFDAGAILEIAPEVIRVGGAEVLRLEGGFIPGSTPIATGWEPAPALRDALIAAAERAQEQEELGTGPEFTGELLLALDERVPAEVAGLALYTAMHARFSRFFFLVADPQPQPRSPPAPAPLAGRGLFLHLQSGGISRLYVKDLLLSLSSHGGNPEPYARELAASSLPAALAEAAADGADTRVAVLSPARSAPWGVVAAAMDDLAGLRSGAALAWPEADPPGVRPADAPPTPAEPWELRRDAPVAVLQLSSFE